MKILKKIKQKITELDRNPGSPQIFYKGIQTKQNFFGGICFLIFIGIALFLIITKSIGVFEKNQLTLKTFVQRDRTQLRMNSQDVVFYLSKKVSTGRFVDIPFYFYPFFGIDVLFVEIYYNFTDGTRNITYYDIQACEDDDDLVCVKDITYKPLCSIDDIDQQICPVVRQYDILILPCNPDYVFCNKTLSDGLLPNLFLIDNKFNVFDLKSSKIFQKTTVSVNSAPWIILLQNNKRILYTVPVTKLIIESDQSVMPASISFFSSVNKTQTFFYAKQTIQPLNRIRFLNAYMDFNLIRSPFTQSYQRSFKRVDQMLAQIFGLLGWLGLLITCMCSGFNRWSMEKYISQNLNKKNEEQIVAKKQNQVIQYTKQSLCCNKDKTQINKIDIIQMHRNLTRVIQILGKQKFDELSQNDEQQSKHENPVQITYSNTQIIQQQIKKSLLQSNNPISQQLVDNQQATNQNNDQ